MREMLIILPTRANDGQPLDDAHRNLRRRLCAEFGGFTAVPSFGGWLNERTGEIVEEPNIAYTVAADDPAADGQLRHLALWFGAEARQEAIYTRQLDGTVEILQIATIEREATVSGDGERTDMSPYCKTSRLAAA